MSNIDYFKRESKKLLKDYKTQYAYIDPDFRDKWYGYVPKFFDLENIFFDFEFSEIEEKNFCLMKANHLIAKLLGFDKWQDILDASDYELELSRLIWENRNCVGPVGWSYIVMEMEERFGIDMNAEDQLFTLKSALEGAKESFNWTEDDYPNYRLDDRSKMHYEELFIERKKPKNLPKKNNHIQGETILSLPLSIEMRAEFIAKANSIFESIVLQIEPENPDLTRKIWYKEKCAEDFIDNGLLREDMLPISKDYALSLIDAFLVHAVIDVEEEANKECIFNTGVRLSLV